MTSTKQAPTTISHHRGLALAVISCAQLMIILDGTIVFVALPTIQRSLHFTLASLVWVTAAYALTFGGLLLFGGRTGDLYGKRRMFMIGIAVFAGASLLGGIAQDPGWLIAARALQGAGGAVASPTALSLIATNFPEGPPRNRAMAVYAAMSGIGSAIGLLGGGLLTQYASWRWVLFVNVPIGVAVLLLARHVLSESGGRSGQLDVPGAVSATAGMTLVVYGLTNASQHNWGSTATVLSLALGTALLAGFVVWERRAKSPLMPLRIFTARNRSGAYAIMLCLGAAVFGMFFFVTQYMQDVLRLSPVKTGLGFLPMAAMIAFGSQLTARVVGRIGVRLPLLAGPAFAAAGAWWLSRLSTGSAYVDVLGPLLLMGAGMGLSFVPLTLTAVSGVRPHESGLAAALLNTGQQVGGALGLAVLSTVAVSAINTRAAQLARAYHGHLTTQLVQVATVHGWDRGFLVGSAIGVVALAVSALGIRSDGSDRSDRPDRPGRKGATELSLAEVVA